MGDSGWLGVEEGEHADLVGKYGGVSLRYPMPPRLGPGMARSIGSIRVTKEWSVETNKPGRSTEFDVEEVSQEEIPEVTGHSL